MKNKRYLKLLILASLLLVVFSFLGCSEAATDEVVYVPCEHCGAEVDSEDEAVLLSHSACEYCNDPVCVGEHGDGICNKAESAEPAASEEESADSEPAAEPTPTPVPLSSDSTLRAFSATFPNGKTFDMKDPDERKDIVVVDQKTVDISAAASDRRASISGHTGTLELKMGANDFRAVVTAEDGTKSYFDFTITVVKPRPRPTPTPAPVPAPSEEPTPSESIPPSASPDPSESIPPSASPDPSESPYTTGSL